MESVKLDKKLLDDLKSGNSFSEPQKCVLCYFLGVRELQKGWAKKLTNAFIDEVTYKCLLGLKEAYNDTKKIRIAIKEYSDQTHFDYTKYPYLSNLIGKRRSVGINSDKICLPKKTESVPLSGEQFYKSKEWKEIRVQVLEEHECKCMMCGRSPKKHGVVIHVDHIKPVSMYPHLRLVFDNLQLLCEDCNLGKSNKYETDWRPLKTPKII